ncbi:MAG: twin-arginine translocase TatA/TatE family subunit [Microthrixaceae bacterium]
MFNITPGEFLMIAMLALIVLGPERLPDMARNLGKMIHKLRTLTAGLQDTVSSISDDPSMKPLKDLGELATRPRQKLAQFAAEAEAEERADRIAKEREEMDRQQRELEESRVGEAPEESESPETGSNAKASDAEVGDSGNTSANAVTSDASESNHAVDGSGDQ